MPAPRIIPSIDALRRRPIVRDLERRFGSDLTMTALRVEVEHLRHRLRCDPGVPIATSEQAAAAIDDGLAARLPALAAPSLRRVINATGVIIHTNLGRAPLAGPAIERLVALGGCTNLEYDLEQGRRGARDTHAETLLCHLTGAEAGVVVNNNAAATLLVLAALAQGREVIVSRGELVEIGGGFRVPDIMAQSGAILREVGTTNRTRLADYAAAASERTALILRVHPSNFRVEGFTERPALADLTALAATLRLPVVEDLGSGFLGAGLLAHNPIPDEPTPQRSLAEGVSIVCFSGDKLLGGPQSGIVLGRKERLAAIRRHPLMRAVRADKLTYAALEATLIEYACGRAVETIPVLRMLALPLRAIETRALKFAAALSDVSGLSAATVPGQSTVGGGSAPGSALATRLVTLRRAGWSADRLEAALRASDPPVIARIADDIVALDLRTVAEDDDVLLTTLVRRLGEHA